MSDKIINLIEVRYKRGYASCIYNKEVILNKENAKEDFFKFNPEYTEKDILDIKEFSISASDYKKYIISK